MERIVSVDQIVKLFTLHRMVKVCMLFFVISFLFAGCTMVVAKVFYGVKSPKFETKESLLTFLTKKQISTENVFCVSAEEYKSTLALSNNKIPDVFIFNKQGEYIPYGYEWACNTHAFNFIEHLNNTTVYPTGGLISLNALLTRFRHLNASKLSDETISQIKDTDFIIISVWTKWSGKFNKMKIKEWEEQAKANTNARISFVKLNMDLQKWWKDERSEVTVRAKKEK